MYWLSNMRHADLEDEIRRLTRDVEDFTARARKEAVALEREGRAVLSDPLHQRLATIRDHLRDQLRTAQVELARRERAAAKPNRRSFRQTLAGLLGARA